MKMVMALIKSSNWGQVKIQDYFIISSEKLKRGWILTTSQYTITHILYFKTQKNSYWKYKTYIINKLEIYVIYAHSL